MESFTSPSMTYKVMRLALETRDVSTGFQQFGDRVFAVERYEIIAELVAHGVERDGQHATYFRTRARWVQPLRSTA
jgi:hypothetical protein